MTHSSGFGKGMLEALDYNIALGSQEVRTILLRDCYFVGHQFCCGDSRAI
jgi:hypothetical protein